MTWRVFAACRGVDPDLFFQERGEQTKHAKAVCESCPVCAQCLVVALASGEKFGIWGGMSERQRRRLRRDLGVVAMGGLRMVAEAEPFPHRVRTPLLRGVVEADDDGLLEAA